MVAQQSSLECAMPKPSSLERLPGVRLSSRTYGADNVGDQGGVLPAEVCAVLNGEPLQFASRLIERISGRSRRVCGAISAE